MLLQLKESKKADVQKLIAFAKENSLHLQIGNDTITYKSIAAYDSAQSKLPNTKKDSWIES